MGVSSGERSPGVDGEAPRAAALGGSKLGGWVRGCTPPAAQAAVARAAPGKLPAANWARSGGGLTRRRRPDLGGTNVRPGACHWCKPLLPHLRPGPPRPGPRVAISLKRPEIAQRAVHAKETPVFRHLHKKEARQPVLPSIPRPDRRCNAPRSIGVRGGLCCRRFPSEQVWPPCLPSNLGG